MAKLYPSWIEIPVDNLERALKFYRAVFELTDTPIYDEEPPDLIAVLLASDKSVRNPGVSLVKSPRHKPSAHGVQVNFHVGDHASLKHSIDTAIANGGEIAEELVDMGDGVKYIVLHDCEGNTIALSSYEEA